MQYARWMINAVKGAKVNRELECLKCLPDFAVKRKYIVENPAAEVEHFNELRERPKRRKLTLDEENRILDAAPVYRSHRNRFTVSRTGGMRIHYLPSKSRWNFRMKRTALFTLFVALSVAWSIPAKAQSPGVAEYARQSMAAAKKQQKANRKAAKKQQKSMKKYEKAQRNAAKKEAKKSNRPA
jgi:hypothetical protein